jgi:hypothetical protein
LKGRERLRPSHPENLTIYGRPDEAAALPAQTDGFLPAPALVAERPSLKARLASWLSA